MTIDPGTLNDRITLQRSAITDDPDAVFPVERFTDIATVWAKYRPTGGREFREGSVATAEERATFTIHYREDLDQADRLIFAGRVWNIVSIARVGWKAALDINATSTGLQP